MLLPWPCQPQTSCSLAGKRLSFLQRAVGRRTSTAYQEFTQLMCAFAASGVAAGFSSLQQQKLGKAML